ncbi:hypothetical protein [Actinomadura macrotermitis]|uniref:Uncharacterized protein n=1 Tax=Actinomadura macrotermitis TaxID=2585200 RepID=A0A7K0BTG5_9ACTN|nr:hypothetical protein [Actinomadura macrotermitis]MQY04437.1 hypothetical protein [Actinomadura macrotermitis]
MGDEPVGDEPVVGEPASDEPVVGEPASDEPASDEPVVDARDLETEVHRLQGALRKRERELRDRDRRLRETQARLTALEASTALAVGRRLAAAARKPGKGLVALPRDLFRMAKGDRAPRTAPPAPAVAPAAGWPTLRTEVGQDERLLFGAALRPSDKPVVAGAFTARTRAALGEDAHVVGLVPHDAGVTVDQADPDVVVFEAAACAAGHPWAYLGDAAAVDRQRALLAVREAARALGRPVVLWRNAPCAPGLEGLGWDAVHDGDTLDIAALT